MIMTAKRRRELRGMMYKELSLVEIKTGYHFCSEWDGLLVGPEDPEYDYCSCDWSNKEYYPNGKPKGECDG